MLVDRRRFFGSGFLAGAATLAARAGYGAGSTDLVSLDEHSYKQMVAGRHGQVLMVDFWATWCAPCREELPKLVAMAEAYRPKGVALITVSCNDPEQKAQALSFIRQKGAPGPYYIREVDDDDKFAASIDPKWSGDSGALPALFLYDRSGRQAQAFIGDTSMKIIQAALEKLLATR
jgi:cytochrome c biogenesis protein CcmG/thiol:disulfide interchange protein DsbE